VSRDVSIRHQHRVLSTKEECPCVFSVCCLVTRWKDYEVAREAFELQGFGASNSEFLVCDNSSENNFDAYQAIRLFLREARGRYVVMAHQDAYPLEHCNMLLEKLTLLEQKDPMWGVVGNAGVHYRDWPVAAGSLRMPDSGGIAMKTDFKEVSVLDENVLIVKNGCGITVSADLSGYHLYGLDVCSVAARIGFTSYAVNYLWHHGSHGTIGSDFFASKKMVEAKLRKHFSFTSLPTTCTYVSWGPSKWKEALSVGRSFFQVMLNPRHADAQKYLWEEGRRNKYFFLALVWLAAVHGPRMLANKVYRTAKKLGWTKSK
jgi:hypothetical protein